MERTGRFDLAYYLLGFKGFYGSKNPHILRVGKGGSCLLALRAINRKQIADLFFDSFQKQFLSFIKDLSI